jgi:hypothetical protein
MIRRQYLGSASALCFKAVEAIPTTNIEDSFTFDRIFEIDISLHIQDINFRVSRAQDSISEIDLVMPWKTIYFLH